MKTHEIVAKREALEELVRTEGWQYFVAHTLNEWKGEGYVARMGTALAADDRIHPQVVHRTAMEMVRLLEWPNEQIRELKGVPGDE